MKRLIEDYVFGAKLWIGAVLMVSRWATEIAYDRWFNKLENDAIDKLRKTGGEVINLKVVVGDDDQIHVEKQEVN